MSIEQDLKTIPTPKTPKHQVFLKAALVTHAPIMRTRRLKLMPLFALVPAFALLLFMAIAIIQPNIDSQGGIVQNTFGPLTPQRVLAIAQEGLGEELLQPGQYYYSKVAESVKMHETDATCRQQTSVSEYYTNIYGVNERAVHKTADGKLYLVTSENDKGYEPGSAYYADTEAENSTYAPVECPVVAPHDGTDAAPEVVDADPLGSSPELIAQQDLVSNAPGRQQRAYDVLQGLEGWKIVEHQTIEGYNKPVILLVHSGEHHEGDITYYFDQSTKQFVGYENIMLRSIVVERGLRSLPVIPEADNKPSPAGV